MAHERDLLQKRRNFCNKVILYGSERVFGGWNPKGWAAPFLCPKFSRVEQPGTIKAIVYYSPLDVRLTDKPDPKIEQPTDVLVQITTTNICGSDLHMYEGRTNMEAGRIFCHENLGKVVEFGPAVR